MSEIARFAADVAENIARLKADHDLQALSRLWLREVGRYRYTYNFTWLGRPVIQLPQDLMAIQEIIWQTRPELVVETGIAHGGSLIFHASLLELIGAGHVVGVDVDIREHNRREIDAHPLRNRITLIEGSSTADDVIAEVRHLASGLERVLVVLDSSHTHAHVLRELELYSALVRKGSYIIVLDTVIEDMPDDYFPDRPWGRGNNPRTAVREFLRVQPRFVVDRDIESKLSITVAPGGYLKCTSD